MLCYLQSVRDHLWAITHGHISRKYHQLNIGGKKKIINHTAMEEGDKKMELQIFCLIQSVMFGLFIWEHFNADHRGKWWTWNSSVAVNRKRSRTACCCELNLHGQQPTRPMQYWHISLTHTHTRAFPKCCISLKASICFPDYVVKKKKGSTYAFI